MGHYVGEALTIKIKTIEILTELERFYTSATQRWIPNVITGKKY